MKTTKHTIARINCGCGDDECKHARITLYAERDETGQYQITAQQPDPRPDDADECWDVETPPDTKTLSEIREIIAAWYASGDWALEML